MEWMLMPLRRYAEFSGRSRRKEYWMFALLLVLIYLVFAVLMVTVGAGAFMAMAAGGGGLAAGALGGGAMLVFGLFAIFILAIIIPSIAVAVRRLHDTDRSGWWILLPLVPNVLGIVAGDGAIAMILSVVSFGLSIALLVFYCLPGTRGPNRFGADPKGENLSDVFA